MTRERLFLLSLESAIFLEKYNGKFKLMGLSFKIKNLLLISLIFLGINSLKSQEKKTEFKTGADRHELYLPLIKGKTVGIVTNQTGLLGDKTHLVDFLVKNKVKNAVWLPDTKYLALFINPVPKLEKDENRRNIYYKIKEILLEERIFSQVIKSEHLFKNGKTNSYFNTFLPHIEIAMLAKLGGVPWRLNRPTNNELIVGVGAFYSVTRKTRFVGSAFCFNNEGIFKGFDCFRKDDTVSLAGSIREAVGKFIVANHTATRLIIHFYKDIGKKELEPILKTLHTLGLNIPVIIVSINKTESKDLLGFDLSSADKLMPLSGTIIKVANTEYLLFNNTRYTADSKPGQKEYHFPIKIAITSTIKGMLDDMNLVEQLIDQVYQFSRMYWKSTDQQSLPVTIKYPEMVAQIYPHFEYDRLNDFGRENLWFL